MKKQLTILFLMTVLFSFKSFSFAQQRDSLIQLYPTLGDTISRFEKEFYNLYKTFPGFEEATVYIRNNDSLISKITYITEHGEEKDTTLVQPLFMLSRTRIYIHNLSKIKEEELRENKTITVTTVDGNELTGNIASIDNNKLILFTPPNHTAKEGYNDGLRFTTIGKDHVKSVMIPGESKILSGMLWGGLIGAVAGFASYGETTEPVWALEFSIMGGLIGAAIGLIVGAIISPKDELIEIKSDADYDKLKYEFKDLYMANNYHNKLLLSVRIQGSY